MVVVVMADMGNKKRNIKFSVFNRSIVVATSELVGFPIY
jgi:hypothetical protein